jgi:hypothetical protein
VILVRFLPHHDGNVNANCNQWHTLPIYIAKTHYT